MAVAEGAVATYVECPQCHSPKAGLAEDHQPWKRSYFCPNCEYDWGIPRTPTMLEEPFTGGSAASHDADDAAVPPVR